MKKYFLNLVVIFFVGFIFSRSALTLYSDDHSYPVAVSPGLDMGIALVGESCPTFSWTGVQGSTGYRLKIFETTTLGVLAYQEMEALAQPVISKEFQGAALSWTPNWSEAMRAGVMYTWYVAAVDAYGQEKWSESRQFEVDLSPMLKGIEERLKKTLKEFGVNEDTINNLFKDTKANVDNVVAPGSGLTDSETSASARIQGHESWENTFFGTGAGYMNTEGFNNTFIGMSAGYKNTVGKHNTFIGHESGYYSLYGNSNTFLGTRSGFKNSLGEQNTFIGTAAGHENLSGHYNTFLGYKAGFKNREGIGNTYIGRATGHENASGYHNTYLGYCAGRNQTHGYGNTFLGYASGYINITGNRNLFLGYKAGSNETGSDRLYIANSDTFTPLIYGEFDKNIVCVNGRLGVGTTSPSTDIEIKKSGLATLKITNASGAAFKLTAGLNNVQIGSATNHGIKYIAGGSWKMQLNINGTLTMSDGGSYNGTWNNASSRELKENIESISSNEAFYTLENLEPVKYNYKKDKEELHAGFIAEDVPELVATNSRKNISTMDIVAVLTKVVKEQQKVINRLVKKIEKPEEK